MSQERGDHGTLGEDEQKGADSGTSPGDDGRRLPPQITPSYDLFGNPLMPASSDPVGSAGPDRGSRFNQGTTGSPPGAVTSTTQSDANKQTISVVTYVIGGLGVLAIFGFFAVMGVKMIMGWHHDTKTISISTSTTTATDTGSKTSVSTDISTTSSGMSPTEIYKACAPSVVTLTIITKGYAVSVDRCKLTDPYGEGGDDPILALLDDNGKPTLYQKGKPVEKALGILHLPKGTKGSVLVVLAKATPFLFAVDEDSKPVLEKGKVVPLPLKTGFEKYDCTGVGSGFYVRPNIVATNWHVVSDKAMGDAGFRGGLAQVTDKPAKFTITDKPIAFDPVHDLALVYVPGTDCKPLTMEPDYGKLKVGEPVYALGSPYAMAGSISDGIVASDELRPAEDGDRDAPKLYIQHSAKIDHGFSGGPLLDNQGHVVGVNTAHKGNGAVNLAVAARYVEDLLDKPSTQEQIDKLSKKSQVDLHG